MLQHAGRWGSSRIHTCVGEADMREAETVIRIDELRSLAVLGWLPPTKLRVVALTGPTAGDGTSMKRAAPAVEASASISAAPSRNFTTAPKCSATPAS